MKKIVNFSILVMIVATALSAVAFQTAQAQQTRVYKMSFDQVADNYSCSGYIVFDAVFAGFASRLSVRHAQLFIDRTHINKDLEAAILRQGIAYEYHDEIGTSAYKIPRFILYMAGDVTVGKAHPRLLSAPFKVQVSETLGDFTTPEFDFGGNEQDYKGESSWENSGTILQSGFRVTQIYFKDYDIRIR